MRSRPILTIRQSHGNDNLEDARPGCYRDGMKIDPLLCMIPATVAVSFAFMLPTATAPNAIVFASRRVTPPQMVWIGLGLNIVGILGPAHPFLAISARGHHQYGLCRIHHQSRGQQTVRQTAADAVVTEGSRLIVTNAHQGMRWRSRTSVPGMVPAVSACLCGLPDSLRVSFMRRRYRVSSE